MLNIPAEVKALFKSDSVFKNFHVNFPNGEHTDLNNDDVISESVSFTESICSKDVFQFGLSERPQIEFECVNVPNIYGVTIYCAIEICVDSLGAQWISDHQPTGNEAFLEPQVCTYGVKNMYRIPYGSFIVQSCPRSHGAMYRRRVTAYGKAPQDITLSSFLNQKFGGSYILPETITQNAFGLIADATNSIDFVQTTHTVLNPINGSNLTATIPLDQTYELYLEATVKQEEIWNFYYNSEYIFGIHTISSPSFRNSVLSGLKSRGFEIPTGYESVNGETYQFIFDAFFYPFVRYTTAATSQASNIYTRSIITRKSGLTYFYPYMPGDIDKTDAWITIPTQITKCTLRRISGHTTVVEYGPGNPALIYGALYSEQITDQNLKKALIEIKGTSERTAYNADVYSYLNSLDLPGLYNGIFEVLGCFRRTGRTGTDETIVLSNANPYAITPDQYSELWYDDFVVDNIGTVLFTYYDVQTEKDQTKTYVIGDGASVYDMTGNYFLNNLSVTDADEYVIDLIDTFFVPNIGAVTFLPYEMTALNIPYFEPGDYIEIDNGDNGTVETFILARNIDGIQTLYDSVEANSGKLDGEG